MKGPLDICWLGLVEYEDGLQMQELVASARMAGRAPDTLLLLEHPPVITLGRHSEPRHLLASARELHRRGIGLHRIDRGGSITCHCPGQLVAYPIVEVPGSGRGVAAYVGLLEQVLLRCLAAFGLDAEVREGRPGLWVGRDKIASIGIRVRRKVATHGLALNVDCDLGIFSTVVPCGLAGAGVTSIEKLATHEVPGVEDVARVLASRFAELGGYSETREIEKAGLKYCFATSDTRDGGEMEPR